MAKRISVVVSQGQSANPAKRQLEEEIVTRLMFEAGIDVTVIPNLYDLTPDGTGMLALQGIMGNMVILSWLYPRAAHWLLDRNGIRGIIGESLLVSDDEDTDEDDDESDGDATDEEKARVIDSRPLPNRKIYCIDLRVSNQVESFVAEVKRIAAETSTQVVDLLGWIGGSPRADQVERMLRPTNDTALGPPVTPNQAANNGNGSGNGSVHGNGSTATNQASHEIQTTTPAESADSAITRVEEDAARRWYPVIDYSRCTNCMECIDFCLFGVYGVDGVETILVEQPDNCRKGCPACSRVCPENAIIFPQHKTPAIAGANVDVGGLKIDLSKLFGAPDGTEDAAEIAARERDEQLLLAGRDVVGMSGVPRRQDQQQQGPNDELDDLLDELDGLDL